MRSEQQMRGVILAGGEGTRLRPLTLACPKPAVPVANRPFVEHQLAMLRSVASSAILSLNYLPDRIRAVVGDGTRLGMPVDYAVEPQPLGTGGAIGYSREALGGGAFVVLNGDVLCDVKLDEVVAFHRRNAAVATIVLTPVDDPSRYGLVLADPGGRVREFQEKPAPGTARANTINAGIYVLEPEVLGFIPAGEKYSVERGLFPALIERGLPVFAYRWDGYWIDIGTPEKYLQVHRNILDGSFAGAGALQELAAPEWPEARFRAPFLVAPKATIGRGATIGPYAVVGARCEIGEGATVRDSILWDRVRVGRGASLDGVVVTDGLSIGAEARVIGGMLGPGSSVGEWARLGVTLA